jgi:outer membrane protein TolC
MGRFSSEAVTCLAVTTALSLSVSGCATFSSDAGLGVAQGVARTELGKDVVKVTTDADAMSAEARVAQLLRRPLTADSAVQIALLKNRGLQAAFNDLGVSEADFVRATLPPTPRISVTHLVGSGFLEIERQIVVSLLELATLPTRQAIAETRFRAAQYRAANETFRVAANARRQFYRTVAANQAVGFLQQALGTAEAASTLTQSLGETGAINRLEQAREHAFYAEAAAQLAAARIQQRSEREALTRLLGLWGRDIDYRLPASLPPLPGKLPAERDVEARALENRVDLQMARADLQALAGQFGLTQATRFVSAFSIGLGNRDERTTSTETSSEGTTTRTERLRGTGPVVDFTIPIYDFGQTGVVSARETYFAAANRLAERAVNTRSEAREAYLRYRGQYDLTRHYEQTLLPLRQTIQNETLLQTNGMIVDAPALIQDARARILANIQAINARRDFWIASTDLKTALIGGTGSSGDQPASAPAAATASATPAD